ncbi:CAP domain-containing protein [Candidatus Nitrotoga arctica]|uniref:CAP domain-containing protein n=1 Tax=Candidatus Nitrotoga arctica TaxID=453162 RepID=UPI003B969A37
MKCRSAIIAIHNKWRAEVGVTEKLGYSPVLAVKAQAWADNLKHTNHCRVQHSKPRVNTVRNYSGPVRGSHLTVTRNYKKCHLKK